MKKMILWILCMALALATDGQQLCMRFVKTATPDTVWMCKDDYVRFAYKGYRGQQESITGAIVTIKDDSTLLIQTKKFFLFNGHQRTVHLKDIEGFRKFNRSRELMRLGYFVLITGADLILFQALDGLPDILRFAASVISGVVIVAGDKILFPNKIKNNIGDKWKSELVHR